MRTELEQAYVDEANRVFGPGELRFTKRYSDHEVMTRPEPCESCGTTLVAFRLPSGRVKPCQFGELVDGGRTVRMWVHSPRRCRQARGAGS